MDLTNPIVLSMLRQMLTSLGTAAITAGYMNSGQLEAIVGGVMVGISVLWSIFKKPAAKPPATPPVKK